MLCAYFSLSILLAFIYVLLIGLYLRIWQQIPIWPLPRDYEPTTVISVLIPARNEEEHIAKCLASITQQNYPKSLVEIIVLDDFSTDRTAQIAKGFGVNVIRLKDFIKESDTQSFKKKAIEIGVNQAKGELIVTTDADVVAKSQWLSFLVNYYEETAAKFIAAPVNFYQEKNLLERFQSLDFMGMMCVTAAGINGNLQKICNGANMAYPKSVFMEVDGFDGTDHLASGDDVFLMHKIISKYPDDIYFLKNAEATIFTEAKPDLKSFISQRLRWATKNTSYNAADGWKTTAILVMVFFFCCNILFSLLLIPLVGNKALLIFLLSVISKLIVDYFFLNRMARFFNRSDLMKYFLPAQLLHILYIVGIGFAANLIKRYEWKGRNVQ